MSRFLNELERRVLVFDGGMGTGIQQRELSVEDDFLGCENCSEILVRTRPEVIQAIHESYFEIGADAVETDTFGASRLVLGEFGLADEVYELNKAAVEIARAAADRFSTGDKPRFVAGSIGPGTKLISLGQSNWEEMLDSYREQVRGLVDGGVDLLLVETCQDLLQAKCAVNGCLAGLEDCGRDSTAIPIFVSITMETNGTMLLGTEIEAAATALRSFPIAGLGLNCATGPAEMGEHLAYLAHHWDRFVSVMPNAGLPTLIDGETVYPLGPEAFAEAVGRFVREYGVQIVGGCCGTTPGHVARLCEVVDDDGARVDAGDGRDPGIRRDATDRGTEVPPPHRLKTCATADPGAPGEACRTPAVSSLYHSIDLKQETSFLVIGERTNANGSRKFKRMLNEEDWDGLVTIAKDQVDSGAHMLDVCVDYVGRDGVRDVREVVGRFVRQVSAPLMIDSTEANVIEAALQLAGGKCMVNSISLEDGEARFDEICPLLKMYGAGAVALTIDEDAESGMAKTADRKVEIADRMYRLYTEKWGLDAADLMFDPLTFTVGTGQESDRRLALETLDAIERIAEKYPECGIVLGVSNVSFGLKPAARHVLNSVFLHEALGRGLTAAIVHASKIVPQHRIPDELWAAGLELIYDRRRPGFDPLHAFIDLFSEGSEESILDAVGDGGQAFDLLTIEEKLRRHIIEGRRDLLTDHLEEALRKYRPIEVINDHLLDGMKTVGELFGAGTMQLPFVLESAEVMKLAVAYLEPHLRQMDTSGTKGRIVLATVKGDVHDIGKNLVDIILSNNGFDVVNLGIRQSIAAIIKAFEEHGADAIGLSGLLVKSVNVMEENLRELKGRGLSVPVLLGGAALTRRYAEGHLREVYDGSLYYGKDAFEGLKVMSALVEDRLAEIDGEIDQRVSKRARVESTAQVGQEGGTATAVEVVVDDVPSVVDDVVDRPVPPFWGDRLVEDISLDEIYPFVNTVSLFRGQWGFRKRALSMEEYERSVRETAEPTFERLKEELRAEKILRPKVVYGYFPVQSHGDDLIVFDPNSPDDEIERFSFPRQSTRNRRCISDYFLSCESGQKDVLGLFACTVGVEIGNMARQLVERNRYRDYLYMHGMGVESAEALAEMWHQRMRVELGIAGDDSPEIRRLFRQEYRGSRYSFGYPACPNMDDQALLFRLLRPERIGCILTENHQIDPEQSVSAMVVHHPGAKYFSL